jgi:hypothetical protein
VSTWSRLGEISVVWQATEVGGITVALPILKNSNDVKYKTNDTNSVESETISKTHYTYENTYTDENRKKNNIEIVFAVLLILLPASVPRNLSLLRTCLILVL